MSDKILHNPNTLKTFQPRIFFSAAIEFDNSVVEEFLTEIMVMGKLKHPNVMKLLGVTVHEDQPCIVMPLMMTDLKQYLKQNKLVR